MSQDKPLIDGRRKVTLNRSDYAKLSKWAQEGRSQEWASLQLGQGKNFLVNRFEIDEKARNAWDAGKVKDREEIAQVLRKKAVSGHIPSIDRYMRMVHDEVLVPNSSDRGKGGLVINVHMDMLGADDTSGIKTVEALEPEALEHAPIDSQRPTEGRTDA